MVDNYEVLRETWEQALDIVRDSDTRAHLIGVSTVMKLSTTSSVFFSDSVSCSIPIICPSLSATDAHSWASLNISTLQGLWHDEAFCLFWANVLQHQSRLGVVVPELARKRRPPAWLAEGSREAFHHSTPEALYRQEFFRVVDLATNTIKDRFDQPGYQTIASLEKLLQIQSVYTVRAFGYGNVLLRPFKYHRYP